MKKKMMTSILVFLFIIICIKINSFASVLDISISSNKESCNVGDEINVQVSWTEKMQAAGFTLDYDSNKIEFVSASIGDSFYNTENKGKIEVAWASFDDTDCTSMSFKFKAIGEGSCNVSVSNPSGFADGNLEVPTDYNINNGTKSIQIKKESGNAQTESGKVENESGKTQNESGKVQIETNNDEKPKTDKTVSNQEHPKTGLKSTELLIIVVITITIVSYKKYKNLNGI